MSRADNPLQLSMTYFCCPEVITLSDCARFQAQDVQHLIGNSVSENCSKVMGPFAARLGHDVGRDRAHVIKQDPPAPPFREKQMHPAGVRTQGMIKQLTTRCGLHLHVEDCLDP